jgi:tetratricopeptide (TPR) repeat protein
MDGHGSPPSYPRILLTVVVKPTLKFGLGLGIDLTLDESRKSEAPTSRDKMAPAAGLDVALGHAVRLLGQRPDLAIAQAEEILKSAPGHPQGLLILAIAKRLTGDAPAAGAILTHLARADRQNAELHFQLGLALADQGQTRFAKSALQTAVGLKPQLAEAWQSLSALLALEGDDRAAQDALAQHIRASLSDPLLLEAASHMCAGRLAQAERDLRCFLKDQPDNAPALRMLGEVGTRLGQFADAEALLEHCVHVAPEFLPARHNYAVVLYRQGKAAEAIQQIDHLLQAAPKDANYLNLKAAALGQIGDYDTAIDLYADVLRRHPDLAKTWMSYGHALKTAGRTKDGVDAYRRAIELMPNLGEAYWSLANLKTIRFSDSEITAMKAQLARDDLSADDRLHFEFALGKAYEDRGEDDACFDHYEQGNRIRRTQLDYDADEMTAQRLRAQATLTAEFFGARKGFGDPAPDPIFVLGLPRSGSTLIEQILSSHPAIEGTMELPEISSMARQLGARRRKSDDTLYPEILGDLSPERCAELGAEFLDRTKVQRKLGRAFFIDKMPHNFLHIGLIHLILPNAKIIDARRHPMATAWSVFKQHFARGQAFSYNLVDIARYYQDYVALMDHFDCVLPGRIHRVIHEHLVDGTETEVRAILDYCGLPFDPACLKFFENDRAVRTASSEQVRRPISREGLDQWRRFEHRLTEAQAILAPIIAAYPTSLDASLSAHKSSPPTQALVA